MSDLSQIRDALEAGFLPDLDLSLDEWSDRYMIIPKSSGSNEYGPYRTQRTPHAREIMKALSDNHPCKRVVCKVASQMFKTQIALNWLLSTIDQSPSNFIMAMPTGKLHKRIAMRIDKAVAAVDRVRNKVAKPNSRDEKNNLDIKEFAGGALLIVTAGSSSDLAEVPARRCAGDEIDKWEVNLDSQGDPIKQLEARLTTFGDKKKSYYYSSPTIKDASRIDELYEMGTKRVALAECIHCGHPQELIFENLVMSEDGQDVFYPCVECGGIHKESDKPKMFVNGLFSDGVAGDGETESFTASAMFLPYGWTSWRDLMREYNTAKILLDAGNEEQMIVFYNTRLARCWEIQREAVRHEALMQRAGGYRLGVVPSGGCILTAAIDTQADRLELKVVAWGLFMECWVVDYRIIIGDPAEFDTWAQAKEILTSDYRHESGHNLKIQTTFIDSGGHHTQQVYDFARKNKSLRFFAIKGESVPGKPIIPNRPSKVDFNQRGEIVKRGQELWKLGVDTAKDYLYPRWKKESGAGSIHFPDDLPEDYYKQLVSEYRVSKFVNGRKRTVWEKKRGDRNEALDLMVYNLAAAYKLGLHRLTEAQWNKRINLLQTKIEDAQETESEEISSPKTRKKKLRLRKSKFNFFG